MKEFCDRWLDAWSGNRPSELIAYYDQDAFYCEELGKMVTPSSSNQVGVGPHGATNEG